jgi:hypothetical protein
MLPPSLLNNPGSCTPLSVLSLSPLIFLGSQSSTLIIEFQSFQLDLALFEAAEHALNSYRCFDSFFLQEVFDVGL